MMCFSLKSKDLTESPLPALFLIPKYAEPFIAALRVTYGGRTREFLPQVESNVRTYFKIDRSHNANITMEMVGELCDDILMLYVLRSNAVEKLEDPPLEEPFMREGKLNWKSGANPMMYCNLFHHLCPVLKEYKTEGLDKELVKKINETRGICGMN